MRTIEAHGQEERLATVVADKLAHDIGSNAVSKFIVSTINHLVTDGTTDPVTTHKLWRNDDSLVLHGFVLSYRVPLLHPRRIILMLTVLTDVAGHVGMINLAHACNEIAVVFKELWQRHGVRQTRTEIGLQVHNTSTLRRIACEERCACGTRERELAIGVVETHGVLTQAVKIRGLHHGVIPCTKIAVKVITHDEEHVGTLLLWHIRFLFLLFPALGIGSCRGYGKKTRHAYEQFIYHNGLMFF